jgi:putative ABC transport system ATP-binding protein
MIALDKVGHTYAGEQVLAIDEWNAAQGEHWLILGPSGSGKTTLLHILAGILKLSEGKVVIAGQALDVRPIANT